MDRITVQLGNNHITVEIETSIKKLVINYIAVTNNGMKHHTRSK